jgi:hypothetical protein
MAYGRYQAWRGGEVTGDRGCDSMSTTPISLPAHRIVQLNAADVLRGCQ